jgi:FkbM family methyltransferase
MSAEEWKAYRDRVRRRNQGKVNKPVDLAKDGLEYTGDLLHLEAHGRSYKMHEFTGKLASCMRAGKPYERKLLEYIYSMDLIDNVAIDAGAHVGNHTMWMAAICGIEVKAFEPGRHEDLRRNVDLNRLGHMVEVYPYALSDRKEQLAYMGKGQFRPGPKDKATFQTVTIDEFHLEKVGLIKIDVEGMEPKVIRGAEQTINRCHPVIFAEVLEPWGYRMVRQFSGKESRTPVGEWTYRS